MSREFPDWVNPWTAAEGGREFRGTLPLSRMKRLMPLLAETGPDVGFVAKFELDEDRIPLIDLSVEAKVPLTCQASLEVFEFPVARNSLLAVIEEPAEQDALPGHYEAVRADHGRVSFSELVEEELLLALPQVPRKPGLDPVDWETGEKDTEDMAEDSGRKPFAALGSLLREAAESPDED